jgi:spore coat protein YutH
MNNYLNYYYNLFPEEVHQLHHFFYFHLNNEKYYFIVYDRPIEEVKPIYELNTEMINRNSLVHEIIINKDKQPVTYINNTPYILLKVYVNENIKIDLTEINHLILNTENIKANKLIDRTNWVYLWSKKIDYIEYQIAHIGKKHPLVCESLNYFIGLGENAISYVKNTMLELKPSPYDTLSVAHKRIKKDYTLFELYNPTALIIDYKVRDISEYIKESFFAGKDVWDEILVYFNNNILPEYSLRLLYGRLLYPTYYFDLYEQIINGNIEEEAIIHIVDKVNDYEKFLDKLYRHISLMGNIPPVTWLNKINITK